MLYQLLIANAEISACTILTTYWKLCVTLFFEMIASGVLLFDEGSWSFEEKKFGIHADIDIAIDIDTDSIATSKGQSKRLISWKICSTSLQTHATIKSQISILYTHFSWDITAILFYEIVPNLMIKTHSNLQIFYFFGAQMKFNSHSVAEVCISWNWNRHCWTWMHDWELSFLNKFLKSLRFFISNIIINIKRRIWKEIFSI